MREQGEREHEDDRLEAAKNQRERDPGDHDRERDQDRGKRESGEIIH